MADAEEISVRAHALMQALAEAYADGDVPEGPARGIVGRRSAMDAVMQLVLLIDEQMETEEIPEAMGLHIMSMLMLIREYVFSLPDIPGEERVLSNDLASLVKMLDEAFAD